MPTLISTPPPPGFPPPSVTTYARTPRRKSKTRGTESKKPVDANAGLQALRAQNENLRSRLQKQLDGLKYVPIPYLPALITAPYIFIS